MSDETKNENVETSQEKKVEKKPANVLLGTISYNNLEDYDKFLDKMDVNQAIFVLMAAANYAQARGAYSLDESELIARAMKAIKKTAKKSEEKTEDNVETKS